MRQTSRRQGQRPGEEVEPGRSATLQLNQAWDYSSQRSIASVSIASTGYAVVTDGQRWLCCLSDSGNQLWERNFPEPIVSFRLSRDGGNVLVALSDCGFCVLDVAGGVVWETRLCVPVTACDMRLSDGVTFAAARPRTLITLDQTGRTITSRELPDTVEFLTFAQDDQVALIANSGAFVGLVDDVGEMLWARSFSTISLEARMSPCGRWITLPAFGQGAYLIDREGTQVDVVRTHAPVNFAACAKNCSVILVATTRGNLLSLDRQGAVLGRFELPVKPKQIQTDTDVGLLAMVDPGGSLKVYRLTSTDSSRFAFLEVEASAAQKPKEPLYRLALFCKPSTSYQAQVKLLPGGKYTLLATCHSELLMIDETGRPICQTTTGLPILSLALAPKSYSFFGATEDAVLAFAHTKMLWRRELKTAMLAVNAAGDRLGAMDIAGNVYVFDQAARMVRSWMGSRDARYFLISPSGDDLVVAEPARAVVIDFRGQPIFEVGFKAGADHLAITDSSLYVGTGGGKLSAFELTGEALWEVELNEPVASIKASEDGLLVLSTRGSAFWIDEDGQLLWRKPLTATKPLVFRNQERDYIELFKRDSTLICASLGGELLWRARLEDKIRSLAVDASGEFVAAFDGVAVWLFSTGEKQPTEPDRFDFLEV